MPHFCEFVIAEQFEIAEVVQASGRPGFVC